MAKATAMLNRYLDQVGVRNVEQFASSRGYTHAMAIELGADVMDALLLEDVVTDWEEVLPLELPV